jgi:hypothetical protein
MVSRLRAVSGTSVAAFVLWKTIHGLRVQGTRGQGLAAATVSGHISEARYWRDALSTRPTRIRALFSPWETLGDTRIVEVGRRASVNSAPLRGL